MSMRYYEITAPRADFTGKLGGVLFVEGKARVSFDDTRDEHGYCDADYPAVQVGRSAVLFAQRAASRGYTLVETDEQGTSLVQADEKPKGRTVRAKAGQESTV